MLAAGIVVAKRCDFVSGPTSRGFAVLAHAEMHVSDCTIANHGSLLRVAGALHFSTIPEPPSQVFTHNIIETDSFYRNLKGYFVAAEDPQEEASDQFKAREAAFRAHFTANNVVIPHSEPMHLMASMMMGDVGGDY